MSASATTGLHTGQPRSRVDGHAKVTGAAKYAAEFTASGLLHGVVVSSPIAKGRITKLDITAAMAVPGVVEVFTHQNRMRTAWRNAKFQDEVAPPGAPFRALYDDKIVYSGQPIALVVAETFELARYVATLVHAEYDIEAPSTDLRAVRGSAYVPSKKRSGINPPPKPRGDAPGVLADSQIRVDAEYYQPAEYHNPMEPHASTVIWEGGGKITVHDKTQGVGNTQAYITNVFGLKKDDVHVVAPYMGGGFGSGLRPQYQLYLTVLATLQLERSVRVVLTRDQMFTFGHRPETIQTVSFSARQDGTVTAIRHEAIAETSTFEDYQEVVVNWTGLTTSCENVELDYKLVQLDRYTPADMRAPGAPTGQFAFESALDEMSYKLGIDPIELRLRNYAETDENQGLPHTSKALRDAYRLGAEKFGWAGRNPQPRSTCEGHELVGWGTATGAWDAQMQKTSASATLTPDGKLTVATASADIGTGTYTILTQLAADALGLSMEAVTTKLGDTDLPFSPLEGGSWTAASAGSAVQAACCKVRSALLGFAQEMPSSPFKDVTLDQVDFKEGRLVLRNNPGIGVAYGDIMQASGLEQIHMEESAARDPAVQKTHASYTHSAVFAEVRVDEELGTVRVTRIVNAICAGRILNPKTARSQIIGGVVFGIGMALHEEALDDSKIGRFMNHNFAEYHIPVNADIQDIEVIFVDEPDDMTSPIGVKGLGEIGICGTAAAIANAVYHATGRRVRDLPITIDKLL
ncbi:xanthine dehydrogenase family protein molybdopterin-binding subunit [Acidisphaera sp. L21]|uniref:xanthine dehydrogenase family protein molybdopterin-binding subunit n=1 Tax=Acidisphaera sp. L21 TaxID=1641851 RepID=UPI00131BAFE7|nr:xanthine dehydrogenase family protein molybdopterin-binding subunit [Acidisphaera sp. L21]